MKPKPTTTTCKCSKRAITLAATSMLAFIVGFTYLGIKLDRHIKKSHVHDYNQKVWITTKVKDASGDCGVKLFDQPFLECECGDRVISAEVRESSIGGPFSVEWQSHEKWGSEGVVSREGDRTSHLIGSVRFDKERTKE